MLVVSGGQDEEMVQNAETTLNPSPIEKSITHREATQTVERPGHQDTL